MATGIPDPRAVARESRFTTPPRAADVQRRRREVALTATWLRELRALRSATPPMGPRTVPPNS